MKFIPYDPFQNFCTNPIPIKAVPNIFFWCSKPITDKMKFHQVRFSHSKKVRRYSNNLSNMGIVNGSPSWRQQNTRSVGNKRKRCLDLGQIVINWEWCTWRCSSSADYSTLFLLDLSTWPRNCWVAITIYWWLPFISFNKFFQYWKLVY